jgi:hypothetical protein
MSEPKFCTQLNEDGNFEKVDTGIHCYKVMCAEPGCFQVRYVKSQDRHQIKYCKPHTKMHRLRSRAERARNKRTSKKKAKMALSD